MDESYSYIAAEYHSGQALAQTYFEGDSIFQMRLFREVAKESDYCVQGFIDGLTD
jgi:hypothetical protein